MLRKLQLSASRSFAPLDFRHSHYEKAQDLTSYDEVVGKNKMKTRSKSENSSIQWIISEQSAGDRRD